MPRRRPARPWDWESGRIAAAGLTRLLSRASCLHLTNRTRLPEKLETVGDHIRRRRLTLKLLQRQVAQQLGVNNKRAIYIKHNLRMVQEVCEESDWTLSQIEAREVRIAAWAKVRWSDV